MGKFTIKNLSGKKFGLLTVLNEHKLNKWGKAVWKCKCDCGNVAFVNSTDLQNGNTKSCGCLKAKTSNGKYNYRNSKRLYTIYYGMKARCYKETSPKYKDYGARGIIICKEWLESFEAFCDWALNNGYQEHLSIDRINVNGNYEPSNCRWATKLVQNTNTRATRYLTYGGKTQPLSLWAKELGMNPSSLRYKIINQKHSLEEIICEITSSQ